MMTELDLRQAHQAALPPLLLTSEPGSFAHNTLKVRVPGILRETIALNAFPPHVNAALEELHVELTTGHIRGLREDAPDRVFWDAVSAPHLGKTWLDVPWYWAETFFYRRVLEATRYFQPGIWAGFDPFAVKKQQEWRPDAAPAAVEALLRSLPDAANVRFEALLHASLWGNRTDLSYDLAAKQGGTAADSQREHLLHDDTATIEDYLRAHPGAEIAFIMDNAGTELVMDLALIDWLLATGSAARVHLHLKPQPFFVSDTMVADLINALDALDAAGGEARALAQRLRGVLRQGRLLIETHPAYAASLFFFELPDDLFATLSRFDLVFLKGDVNYRRLLGDAHWPPTTPFARATAYFPAPLVALRTLKAELIVGLAPDQAEQTAAADPEWLVNGKRGVIQARLRCRVVRRAPTARAVLNFDRPSALCYIRRNNRIRTPKGCEPD